MYGDVGGSTRAPLVADLDGDGNTDLVDASGDVGVILLDGSGGVISAASFDAGPSVTDGALGDFDLDGELDLAVTMKGGGLGWMEGVGDGSLLFPQTVVVGGNASQVEAGLMDGDGQLDLVVSTTKTVVALGNGDGTFTALAPTGPAALAGLSVLDLDLDGELDVAGFSGKTLGVQLGNGDGSLGSLQGHVAADAFLKDYVFADLDGDGLREAIAFPDPLGVENIFVSQGLGGGQFGARVELGSLHNPKAVAAADLDLDGAMDVFVVGLASTLTLRGLGNGSLDAAKVTAAGQSSVSVVSADLNGDAFADAVVLNSLSEDVSVMLGGPGPDGLAFHASFPTGPTLFALGVADFTGDQVPDIVVGNKSPGGVRVLPGDGSGNFGAAIFTPVASDVLLLQHADFDEDGVRDVVVSHMNQSNILLGNGDGTFGPANWLPKCCVAVVAGRLNGDAHVDLLVTDAVRTTALFGDGHGAFTLGPWFVEGAVQALQLADLDRDSDQDLVIWGSSRYWGLGGVVPTPESLAVGLNDGSGSFSFLSPSSVTGDGVGIAVADFDEDGIPDLVVNDRGFSTQTGNVKFLRGHGDGTFTLTSTISAGAPVGVAAGDFDVDGITDVVSLDKSPASDATGRLWTILNRVGE